jgi:hypothetical protein
MAIDTRATARGGDKDVQTESVRGMREDKGVFIGIVKVNAHPARQGTIQVFIPEFSDNSRESETSQWRVVQYATPFYSRTDVAPSANPEDVKVKNTSGFVFPAPDIGTSILCVFPEGRNTKGYWFGCAPDAYMMQSVPESAMTSNFVKNDQLVRHTKAPGLDFDDIKNDVEKLTNFLEPKRPLDTKMARTLKAQGLDKDEIRGLTSSNYSRETPSEIIGISSKGRRLKKDGVDIGSDKALHAKLNSGADLSQPDAAAVEGRMGRAKGHALVLDDGDIEGNNNLIRLRTAAGHQIVMHDKENLIYIGNSTGTTWFQMDAAGQVDVYSQTSINLRSRDINMHADGSIKMHAGRTIQLVAGANLHLEGRSMANLYSDKGNTFIYGGGGVHAKSGGGVNIQAGSGMNIKASATIAVQGSCVALQSPAAGASKQKKAKEKTLKDTKPDSKGFWNANKDLKTTLDRVPTHEPFIDHKVTTQPTQYSAVTVNNVRSSTDLTPKIPLSKTPKSSAGLTRVNSLINTQKINPVSIITQDNAGIAIGKLSDKVIRNMAAGQQELAGSGGLPNFVNSITGALGKYGATVENLQKNGYVRPEALFNGQLTDPTLWTGKDGIDGPMAFGMNGFVQENMFYSDTFNSMQSAFNHGAINEDDDEETIAGITMVTYASGDPNISVQYREGQYIEPKPISGTTLIPTVNDMTSEYDKYFQKAVSAVSQAKSTDGTGYTENFYSNLLNDQLIKTSASYMSETARASALQRVKASTGLSKGALLREFNRQISTGEVTVSEAV